MTRTRMEVRSLGSLGVDSLLFRAETGAWTLAVVAKATFVLAPGVSPLLREGGDEVTVADVPWEDDIESSLRYATDLVPFKRCPEVLISGSAYSPGGAPVRSLLVRAAVAGVDKQIEVWGDCHFDRRGRLAGPAPFRQIPLRWERAAGGPGTINPVGVPADVNEHGVRITLPNIRPPGRGSLRLGEEVGIVGVGPISPGWEPRRARLHAHAAMWDLYHYADRPLPEDIDVAYFNAAPEDQLVTRLSPGEVIHLEHLHPEHPRLTTRLERMVPAAELELPSGRRIEVPMICDTLCVVPDRGVATLTFRGHVTLVDPGQAGVVLIGLEEAMVGPTSAVPQAWSPPIAYSEEEPSLSEYMELTLSEDVEEPIETTLLGQAAHGALDPLPFVRSGGSPAVAASARSAAWPAGHSGASGGLSGDTVALSEEPATLPGDPSSLPGEPPAQSTLAQVLHARTLARSLPVSPPPDRTTESIRTTEPVNPEPPWAARESSVPLPAVVPAPASVAVPPAPLSALVPPAPSLVAAPVAPPSAVVVPPAPASAPPAPLSALVPPAPASLPALVPPAPASLPSAPLAPLPSVVPSAPVPAGAPSVPAAEPEAVVEPQAAAAPAEEPPAEPPPLPLDAFPITRCAAITASIDHRPDTQSEVLRDEGVDVETWERLAAHWDAAVRRELQRSKNTLLRAHDAAYVDRLEEERGLLAASDYARLAAEAQVAEPSAALRELDLPPQSWPKIQRVWIARMARDPRLARIVRDLMDQQ